MTPVQSLRERFDRDPLPVKWGGIASDLLRLSGLARSSEPDREALQGVLTETKFFTEWLAPQVGLKDQETILLLQRTLADFSPAEAGHKNFGAQMQEWSGKIFEVSGLAGRG